MDIRQKIWYDLVDAKFGDEYLIGYIEREKLYRKWAKIGTLLLSGGGIFSAFKDFRFPTVVILVAIGIVQLFSLIENQIIHSEKAIDDLCTLRLMYHKRVNNLEKLLYDLDYNKIEDRNAAERFFSLRDETTIIEELDNKVNIKKRKYLTNAAVEKTNKYLNKNYE